MGVVRIGILDADRLQVGNLSRHVLTMHDVGHAKATALAARLSSAVPDAHVEGFVGSFPISETHDRDHFSKWDVVVDCTASDEVLHAMANYPWCRERLFISIAMTWRARQMVAYAASEASMPAVDAIERLSSASIGPAEGDLSEMEGIGCWHPVFPACSDDVQLWGALASKFIRRAALKPDRLCEIFTQTESGSVERSVL